jgi:hypothetical protein
MARAEPEEEEKRESSRSRRRAMTGTKLSKARGKSTIQRIFNLSRNSLIDEYEGRVNVQHLTA